MSSEPTDIAIRVRDLCKRYEIYDDPKDRLRQSIMPSLQKLAGRSPKQYFREFWALRDVSFEVRRGETVGIVGKNGAGKSTLLQLIVGTRAPTSGTVDISGRVTALLELGSGFNPMFTGRDNVYVNAAILGIPRDEVDRRFDEIAAFADIGLFMDQKVSTYSSGMYVRLAFAVQVCLDPDILVVDEALAVGDAYFVHRCFHRIRRLKEQGKTILFVSHDTGTVNNICDRAIWIDDGRLRMQGKPDEVTARYRADLFRLEMRTDGMQPARPEGTAASPGAHPETVVPNSDRRMGGQRCRILGIGLYDAEGVERIAVARPGEELSIRISVENVAVDPGTRLIVGYELFTPRGENFAGMNTRMAELALSAPPLGEHFTLRARVRLPELRQGHYAVTPAVATNVSDEVCIEDRIENAVVFEVLGGKDMGGSWMRLPTTFAIE